MLMEAINPAASAARKREIEKELERIAALKKPLGKTKRKAKALRAELEALDMALVGEVIPCPDPTPQNGQRLAKVYAVPKNRYLRLIEFESGEHGIMRIKPTERLRAGWHVLVQPGDEGCWAFLKEWP